MVQYKRIILYTYLEMKLNHDEVRLRQLVSPSSVGSFERMTSPWLAPFAVTTDSPLVTATTTGFAFSGSTVG